MLFNLGVAYLEEESYDGAIKYLRECVLLDPEDEEAVL